MKNKMTITLDVVETEILCLWLQQASHTTWTNPETRTAMLALAERVRYAVQAQMRGIKMPLDTLGDF